MKLDKLSARGALTIVLVVYILAEMIVKLVEILF